MLFTKSRLRQITVFYSFLLIFACNSEGKKTTEEAVTATDTLEATSPVAEPEVKMQPYTGNYISGEYPDGYYQLLKISENATSQYEISFTVSKVKGRPACSFTGAGVIVKDTLKVPVEWNDKTVQMTLFLRNDTVMVFTENFDDRFALNYYCSGGASLIGDYTRSNGKGL